jgi:hypothetical protein
VAYRNDRRTAEDGRKVTALIRDSLKAAGIQARGPAEAATPGSFILDVETLDGLILTVEVTAFPWRNDGSWRQRDE